MTVCKWEDLQSDCLVKVFGKVGIAALAQAVPFVCKSWYKASINPQCWKFLNFPEDISSKGIKAVVDRSCGNAEVVVFGSSLYFEDFIYVAERCPKINIACLPKVPLCCSCHVLCDLDCKEKYRKIIPTLVGKWKNLQYLEVKTDFHFEEIITEVAIHCKKFEILKVSGDIGPDEVSVITSWLPKIKGLMIEELTEIPHECFLTLLAGCKELTMVDARSCYGFDADDEEILKMASHIKVFMAEGSQRRNKLKEFMQLMCDPSSVANFMANMPNFNPDMFKEIE